MASNHEIDQQLDELCPDCGSAFAEDKLGRGFRRHLEQLPKRDRISGAVLKDADGKPILCGGTSRSWGKGNRSE
jgi:hypothetical protein